MSASSSGADALTLAVDAGSSSVRAALFDRAANPIPGSFTQRPCAPATTPDGGVTLDADAVCDLIYACIDAALARAGGRVVARVALDTLVGNVLGLGADGAPLTPVYTWADQRGGDQAARLGGLLDPADYARRTGCRFHTSYWPARLLWLRARQPDVYARARCWLSFGEYALGRIFGARRASLSAASWSGLLDRHTLAWDAPTLAALGLPAEHLPALGGAPFQGLTGAWAARWPALRDALWFPAVGDGAASNIGAGCVGPGQVALAVGTSGALRVVVPGAPAATPPGLFVYRVDAERSLVGGALSNAGNLYAWLTRALRAPDAAALEAAVAARPPDSHGLTVLPFLAGERAPGWNPRAQAVFMGMTLDTSPADMVRAGLEAVALRFAAVAERLAHLLPPGAVCVASGAAITGSPAWLQIVADALGAPVYPAASAETTLRGAACLALGLNPPPQTGAPALPVPAHRAVYAAAAQRQQALYRRLFDDGDGGGSAAL